MRPFQAPIFALCIGFAQTAEAQVVGQAAASSISPWRVVASLLLCLALGAIAIFALRRRYGLGQFSLLRQGPSQRIKVVEQQALGPQRSVCLIEIDGQPYAALFAPQTAALVALSSAPQTREEDAA